MTNSAYYNLEQENKKLKIEIQVLKKSQKTASDILNDLISTKNKLQKERLNIIDLLRNENITDGNYELWEKLQQLLKGDSQ